MQKTTEEASNVTAQQKLNRTRKYNRDYYHAHKTASDCEHCNHTFSSVSALRKHKGRNIRCKMLHARGTIDMLREENTGATAKHQQSAPTRRAPLSKRTTSP